MGQRAGAAAAATALVLGLAGCSGSGQAAEPDGAETMRRASDVLVRYGSSQVVTSMEMASGGTKVSITGTGGYDFARRRGSVEVTLPADAAGEPEHQPITELLTPAALYMKNRGEGVPADKWVRLDTARLADGNLVTGGVTDPLAAAELLRGARGVTYAGQETIAGVRVRHYRGVTDIVRAAKAASAASRGSLGAAAKGFSVTRVPFEAYVDEQGRLRRLRQCFTFTDNAEVVSVVSFHGFGSPVSVVLPEAGDIYRGKIVSAPTPQA
jgi:hypothetical protein